MSTSVLNNLQRKFLNHLRRRRNDAIFDEVSDEGIPPAVGLRIYKHAYGARLCEALEHDHPVLGVYLGDTLWEEMCHGYLLKHPSHYRSLREFGADLPAYLTSAKTFRRNPEIAEIALFERRLLDSFDAADAERADWGQLLQLSESAWPGLRVRFHPSLRFHRTAYNSVDIWRTIKKGDTPPAVAHISTDWALWRDAERVSRFRSLDVVEGAAAGYCILKGDFVGMCNLLLTWHPAEEAPGLALSYLSRWCEDGWISQWIVTEESD